MNGTIKLVVPLVATLAIAACNGGAAGIPGTSGATTSQSHRVTDWQAKGYVPACPQVVGKPTCLAILQSKSGISPAVAGWGPTDFQTRYNLPSSTKGSGQIVAIVDAYDNPNVASDLAQYRSNFGLGTANFTKYNQNGQTSGFPSGNTGWGVEIDLDVEMVSASLPEVHDLSSRSEQRQHRPISKLRK